MEAVRILLAFACSSNFKLYQMDVKSAFLNGLIKEDVYVGQPPGFEDHVYPNHVFKLQKALYGLKQAPRAWYERLSLFLLEKGYIKGKVDQTLFTKTNGKDILVVQVYVNDIIFGSTNEKLCLEFSEHMKNEFEMSLMGELQFFLGLQVKQLKDEIFVNQSKYIRELLIKYKFQDAKYLSTPMSTNIKLDSDEGGKMVDAKMYRGMTALTASICWNILAHKNDEDSDLGVKVYQRPSSNDIYELRRRNNPPLCKENEKQDAAWYTPIKACLHTIPASIEQRGTDWPEEWPRRLETFPEWLADSQEKLIADTEHWKAVVNKSYLGGMGIDWSKVRNVMDMKAIYGGMAAALASQKVWVMNVVPVHAPNTLPVIFERGLLGIYHDWCEPFSTYPRSYDLLHADHLFARLKNRCKQPVSIVVEVDRILRPGGWVIIRDKLEILNSLEEIMRTLHWEIRMTYNQAKEGIICAQKTVWRP